MEVNGCFLFSIGRYSLILEISSFNKNLRGDKFKMAAQCYQTNQLSSPGFQLILNFLDIFLITLPKALQTLIGVSRKNIFK